MRCLPTPSARWWERHWSVWMWTCRSSRLMGGDTAGCCAVTRRTSAAGAVGVHRTLYRCGRERAVAPMEWRAGVVAGRWTEREPAPESRNRGAGYPDASRLDTKWAVRFGMGDVVRDLPPGSDASRQRGVVSLQTGGVMDQFRTCTLLVSCPRRPREDAVRKTIGEEAKHASPEKNSQKRKKTTPVSGTAQGREPDLADF